MKWILVGVWGVSIAAAIGIGYKLAAPTPGAQAIPRPDVAAGVSDALSDRDMLSRTIGLVEALRRVDESNIDRVVAVFEAQRVGVSAFEVRLLMSSWCRFGPEGAFAWADGWPGPWRETLSNAAIHAWAYRDPRGAAAAFALLEPARQEELRASLVEGWAGSGDTAGLTDHLFSHPASRERSRFIGVLLSELIQLDDGPQRIRRWAEGVPRDAPHQARATAFRTAGGVLAQNDPRNALALYEAHQEFDYAQPALRTIARRWVEFHDAPDLFEWLVTLPPGKARDDAITAGFSHWWSRSPAAARSWLSKSPLDPPLDPAVAVMAREISRASPARAIVWADGIHDQETRRRAVVPILRLWIDEDRRAARAWMRKHSVPTEVQRELLN